jgi:hypothetical protein
MRNLVVVALIVLCLGASRPCAIATRDNGNGHTVTEHADAPPFVIYSNRTVGEMAKLLSTKSIWNCLFAMHAPCLGDCRRSGPLAADVSSVADHGTLRSQQVLLRL